MKFLTVNFVLLLIIIIIVCDTSMQNDVSDTSSIDKNGLENIFPIGKFLSPSNISKGFFDFTKPFYKLLGNVRIMNERPGFSPMEIAELAESVLLKVVGKVPMIDFETCFSFSMEHIARTIMQDVLENCLPEQLKRSGGNGEVLASFRNDMLHMFKDEINSVMENFDINCLTNWNSTCSDHMLDQAKSRLNEMEFRGKIMRQIARSYIDRCMESWQVKAVRTILTQSVPWKVRTERCKNFFENLFRIFTEN